MRRYRVTFVGPGVVNTAITPRACIVVRALTARGAEVRATRRLERMTHISWLDHGRTVERWT